MSVYTYPQSKVVDEVTFRKTEGGHNYAYLHAADDADADTLTAIKKLCVDNGWQCTPYSLGGKPTLQVQGFRTREQFQQLLKQKNWISGASEYIPDTEDKPGFKEQLKKRSLAASGAFYVIGDAAFTKYGYADANGLNIAAGILYGAGTLSLLHGGRKDQSDIQIRDISKKMSEYLKDHGAEINSSCSLESIAHDHKKGLIPSADELFRRYPSELMNLFYAAAGICIARSAHKSMNKELGAFEKEAVEVVERIVGKHNKAFPRSPMTVDKHAFQEQIQEKMHKSHKLESKLDIGLGAMTALSGLFAMLVKEKKPDPDAPEKHGMAAVWEKIQEKPLAVAGVGYMVSTMCHAVSTTLAWQYAGAAKRKSVPWRATFVGANIIAELLLAISSKGHGEGVKSDKTVDHTVIALSADLIVKQPAKMQEALIDHVARFLGKPDVLALKDDVAKKLLHEQVALMRKNPWVGGMGVEQTPDALPELAERQGNVTIQATKEKLANWQAKHALEKAKPSQPQLST